MLRSYHHFVKNIYCSSISCFFTGIEQSCNFPSTNDIIPKNWDKIISPKMWDLLFYHITSKHNKIWTLCRFLVMRCPDICENSRVFQVSLQWRHNGSDGVSNHQPHDCLLNRLFRHRSNKTSYLPLWSSLLSTRNIVPHKQWINFADTFLSHLFCIRRRTWPGIPLSLFNE